MRKKLLFVGDSRKRIQAFPIDVQRNAGHELLEIQDGNEPSDLKTLVNTAPGIKELRLWDDSGTYRVVFVAKFEEAVYVLHAFQKKTQATSLKDLDLVRQRYEEVRAFRSRH